MNTNTNTNATPAEQLAQSLNTQGFEAEVFTDTDGCQYALTYGDARSRDILTKRGYAFHPAPGKYGQGKVLVHCPIPERFW